MPNIGSQTPWKCIDCLAISLCSWIWRLQLHGGKGGSRFDPKRGRHTIDGLVIRNANCGRFTRIDSIRGQKLNPNLFFSNFSGAPGISQQNPGISRPKSLISLVSRDVSNFLAPTRSRGRPLPHWKISGPKRLGLGSFFLPDCRKTFS